ncbi:YetF domain-containing protein [Candidatus Contubernalis alkaliaceticus]|uniref:YetF domain-containing protein n=1 Tax=Candidatus Contubernalis alkaliaceticus TaxID=338645 RepID=UPI001F4C2195|nr:DUF421 domain-containing protein [Candidatus Contubernalis alkalaceticus]UNC92235.1 DUF421 domain-containing protein [Candidatus Contubernalis alkalaceticus]
MFVVMIRTVILYVLVFIVMRIMGKRQIGQLQPIELAVAIMISALAALPMEDISIPLINSVLPILLLLIFQVTVSTLSMKSEKLSAIFSGRPAIVIENGKIVQSELTNLRVNLNDLLEQLRISGYSNISDVEFAIMETTGQISVIPKSQKRPVTPEDLNIETQYEGLCHPLIIDGQLERKNLKNIGLTEEWLNNELKKFGIDNSKEIIFASIDPNGKLYYQRKQNNS